jgi:hypothetical protein
MNLPYNQICDIGNLLSFSTEKKKTKYWNLNQKKNISPEISQFS